MVYGYLISVTRCILASFLIIVYVRSIFSHLTLFTSITGRTFPSHTYFNAQLGAGQIGLFNILKSYSLLDDEVGYCQGLSFVAGLLLMHVRVLSSCQKYNLCD